ncbi:MAG TPA: hypothetical protein VHY59_06035, partial [Chthoniobacterales bacterium]|nr:hypothetical protein [Chthoniobacterales bacterium]
LAQSSLRVSVFVQWVWTYITDQRGSRIIVNHHATPVPPAEEASASTDKAATEGSVPVPNR